MSARLTEYVKHTNLALAHHLAFWNRVEQLLPPDALKDGGELRSMWLAAAPPKTPLSLEPGLKLIREFEGCELEAYDDGVGVWTIGWGNTRHIDGTPVKKGDKISRELADEMLSATVEHQVIPALSKSIPYWAEMSANQRGALTSFAYNLGWHFYGREDFKTISAALRERRWKDVPAAMMLYRNPGSNVEAGLKRRRAAEGNLWASGIQQQQGGVRFTPSSPFSTRVTPHITYGEFALGQEARRFTAQHQCDTAVELAEFMERARREFGGKAVQITSGYRPAAINRSVGGASGSEHLYDAPGVGAVDFLIDGVDIYTLQAWCDKFWPYSLGYGAPKGFVHLGIRNGRPRVRWDY
jgi:GH24 family phage-related lysozyme (muramidase)